MKLLIAFVTVLLTTFVTEGQIINVFAGGGASSADTISALDASIPDPASGVFDRYGNYYFCSPEENKVRKINTSGIIETIAGTGTPGYNGDSIFANTADLSGPSGITLDTIGNIFIADGGNNRIRKVNVLTNIISTVVGNGIGGYSGDGYAATSAEINDPQCVRFDRIGNMYIGDYFNARGRKVNTAGIISTFIGNGSSGYSGDGSVADTCKIGGIQDIAIDSLNNIYIADNANSRIFKINNIGIITTFAGTDTGYIYDGDEIAATSANIDPWYIAFDDSDHLFIADRDNQRVRKIDNLGLIHTVAGNGIAGSSGEGGMATAAELFAPNGIAFDLCNNLYIPEANNARISKVTFADSDNITISGPSSAVIDSNVLITATVSGGGIYSIHWYDNGTLVATTTSPSYTYTMGAVADTITATIVSPGGCFDSVTSTLHIVTVNDEGLQNATRPLINIYPNPVQKNLIINFSEASGSIEVKDMMGKTVMFQYITSRQMSIDMSGLPAGVYMLEVTVGDGTRIVNKVVKE